MASKNILKETTLTLDNIRDLGPCYDPEDVVAADWTGTVIDILKLEHVKPADRIWVAIRLIELDKAVEFAQWCAGFAAVVAANGHVHAAVAYATAAAMSAADAADAAAAITAADAYADAGAALSVVAFATASADAAYAASDAVADAASASIAAMAAEARQQQLGKLVELIEADKTSTR